MIQIDNNAYTMSKAAQVWQKIYVLYSIVNNKNTRLVCCKYETGIYQ